MDYWMFWLKLSCVRMMVANNSSDDRFIGGDGGGSYEQSDVSVSYDRSNGGGAYVISSKNCAYDPFGVGSWGSKLNHQWTHFPKWSRDDHSNSDCTCYLFPQNKAIDIHLPLWLVHATPLWNNRTLLDKSLKIRCRIHILPPFIDEEVFAWVGYR